MSKYHSKKIVANGITYDSRKEYFRHQELILLEKAGAITNLQRQVRYELIPSQKLDGKVVERPCTYIADFVWKDTDGRTHVEDVKGYKKGAAYNVFTIKRKMMLFFHGIVVEEV